MSIEEKITECQERQGIQMGIPRSQLPTNKAGRKLFKQPFAEFTKNPDRYQNARMKALQALQKRKQQN